MNIDKQWSSLYLEYYSKTDNGRYRLDKDFHESPENPTIVIISWDEELQLNLYLNILIHVVLNTLLVFRCMI